MSALWSWVTDIWMWFWTWFNDHNGGIAAVAALIGIGFAVWGIVNAKRDSRDRTRPVVLAEFRLAPDSDTTFDLIVRNAGQSVARNVRVSFDPPIGEEPEDGKRYMSTFLKRRYGGSIPALAPGQELSNIWWSGHAVAGREGLVSEEPTPDEVTVTIAYEDVHGRPYRDQFPLTVDTVLLTTYGVSSSSIKGTMRTMAEQSKKQAAASESMARTLSAAAGRARNQQADSTQSVPSDALLNLYSRVSRPDQIAPDTDRGA